VTYYVLFFIHLESRRVDIAGITIHPDEPWMRQIARNVTMEGCGTLRDCRPRLLDLLIAAAECVRDHATEGARSADRSREWRSRSYLATLHGRGGKTRQCPLWSETERVLADEILGRSVDEAVFVSRLGTPITRFGVYRLIERCAARVRELADRTITPDVIRHTTACHLVLASVESILSAPGSATSRSAPPTSIPK
jgi:integrase